MKFYLDIQSDFRNMAFFVEKKSKMPEKIIIKQNNRKGNIPCGESGCKYGLATITIKNRENGIFINDIWGIMYGTPREILNCMSYEFRAAGMESIAILDEIEKRVEERNYGTEKVLVTVTLEQGMNKKSAVRGSKLYKTLKLVQGEISAIYFGISTGIKRIEILESTDNNEDSSKAYKYFPKNYEW